MLQHEYQGYERSKQTSLPRVYRFMTEVKWALESITTNNANGGGGNPVKL